MKRIISLTLLTAFLLSICCSVAYGASNEALNSAQKLNSYSLFNGVGVNSDGTPDFDLDRAPTREEAITMLVRLLGEESVAKNGQWSSPFADVAEWAKPYVGYAYSKGLTNGMTATTFGGKSIVTAAQYITFVLRALGYSSSTDFAWDSPWSLSDSLHLTKGNYGSQTKSFSRGDVAIISANALNVKVKGTETTIISRIIGNVETERKVTLYALDGRTIEVSEGEVSAYLKVGWYRTLAETQQTMYAPDGRTITIFKSEVPAYKNVGWYETQSAAQAAKQQSSGNSGTQSGSSVNQGKTVYVGETGTKYHYQGCRTLKNGGRAISLEAALAEGRTACKVCH